jgi:phenylacetic acid degradation operon negative regulatory protein
MHLESTATSSSRIPADGSARRRSVGASGTRSVLITLLGEFVLPVGGAVWQETLVSGLAQLGYSEHAARQAISRSSHDGWLSAERHGRRMRMVLTDRMATMLAGGATRIYTFGDPWEWDGRWLMVVLRVPEDRREVRHALRASLAWAGLGSLGGGVWLTPHLDREPELRAAIEASTDANALSFVAHNGAIGEPADLVRSAWDLEAIAAAYDAFIDEFGRLRADTVAARFRALTRLVHEWRRFPYVDPDLPAELLPNGWPRAKAHAIFRRQHERWSSSAQEFFSAVDGEITDRRDGGR